MKQWFKNLKKWQKGGLIGCAIGLLFAGIITLSPYGNPLRDCLERFHFVFFPTTLHFLGLFEPSGIAAKMLWVEYVDYGGAVVLIVTFYGGLGAILGGIQQIANPILKWLPTALLVLFLLFIYCFSSLVHWASSL